MAGDAYRWPGTAGALALRPRRGYVERVMIRIPLSPAFRRSLITTTLILGAAACARAQDDSLHLTGMLAPDLRTMMHEDRIDLRRSPWPIEPHTGGHKSVVLAGALSGVLPGAGQLYAEAPLWRTILYGGIEAAGLTLYFIYNAKGVNATNDFQNFADAHWDVTRYVDWIAANYQQWSGDDVDKPAAAEALGAIYLSHDPNVPPWERVDFAQLNKLERAVRGGFSHTLPEHGDQQYYEEIGKYFQYRSGWDDHPAAGDTLLFDPSRVTPRNLDYVAQRRDANAFGSYATTAIGVVVVNHIVSLIDAALAARSYNISFEAGVHGDLLPNGGTIPAPSLAVCLHF